MDRPDWIFGRCVSCCCGLFYKLQPFIFWGVYVISTCTYLEPVNLFWSYLTLPNGFRCTLDIRYFLYYAWLHRKSGWKVQDEHLASSCKKWTSILLSMGWPFSIEQMIKWLAGLSANRQVSTEVALFTCFFGGLISIPVFWWYICSEWLSTWLQKVVL